MEAAVVVGGAVKALRLFLILCAGTSFVPVSSRDALAEVPVIDNPQPKGMFQSPFNGPRRLDDQEGTDYLALQNLHDLWADDLRAEGLAGAHGTNNPEWKRAHDLAAATDAKFHAALDAYVEKWSMRRYPAGYRPPANVEHMSSSDQEQARLFAEDRAKVMVVLLLHAKSVVFNKH
jgi:hypothetical protein